MPSAGMSTSRVTVDGGFFDRVQEVYREHAPEFTEDWTGLPTADELPDRSAALADTGLFGDFTVRQYPWVAYYDTASYVNLLNTYSDHRTLPADRRQRLFEGITTIIDNEFGGQIAKQYLTDALRGSPPLTPLALGAT